MRKKSIYLFCSIVAFVFVGCSTGSAGDPTISSELETTIDESQESSESEKDASEASTEVKETSAEQNESTKAEGEINTSYSEDIKIKVETINGIPHFAYTAEEFITGMNTKSADVLKNPVVFTKTTSSNTETEFSFESDMGVSGILTVDSKSKQVSQLVLHTSGESIAQNKAAGNPSFEIQAVPILMALDPNMSAEYAATSLTDMGIAGMIAGGEHNQTVGSINYTILTEESGKTLTVKPE